MSVSLRIDVPSNINLEDPKTWEDIEKKVMKKYPSVVLHKGEARFEDVNKATYYYDEERKQIVVYSNGPKYNFVVYTLYGFADSLGVREIMDEQESKKHPLSEYEQIVKDLPLEIEIAKKSIMGV